MPKKLLLAEDSLTIRKVFELALSRSDIAITSVDNGEDAVRLAGEIFPDLVVADLSLPGKNGFAVAAELRAMEKTEKIPVLILSGTLVPLDEARFKASGAKGVLFKPFEARELLETIERLLREETPAPEFRKPQEAPVVDERWDFSDVLDEVEAEAGNPAAPAREGLLPGAIFPGGGRIAPAFNEFDVSIDEIEGGGRHFSAEPPPSSAPPKVEHMDSDLPGDSPPPVTDLSPALDEVEEIEEIEHLEDVEVPLPPVDAVSTGTPASLRVLPDATAQPGDAELRDLFAARAAEIFRTVASEAVEKVMWEMTDRLAVEFSAKLRESVEAVAWEVIPSTAERLIREEIARIRGQAGKPSP
jgi:CheY-like chemotaxis protein